jgi:hypothetical protein
MTSLAIDRVAIKSDLYSMLHTVCNQCIREHLLVLREDFAKGCIKASHIAVRAAAASDSIPCESSGVRC